jgi:hypothetical protein
MVGVVAGRGVVVVVVVGVWPNTDQSGSEISIKKIVKMIKPMITAAIKSWAFRS